MTLKVLVVDDEPLAREAIELRLKDREPFEVCAVAANGMDAVELASTHRPDIIFLDIEMPEMSGIETAKELYALGPQNIVFVTAYDEFAVEAFQINAVDYLLKPIKDEQFTTTLLRLTNRINARKTVDQNKRLIAVLEELAPENLEGLEPTARQDKGPERIAIKDGLTTKLLAVTDIESIVSGKDYICIKVGEDVLAHRCTMKKFLETLPNSFIRCHRSHTVNMAHVTAIEHGDSQMELHLKSGDRHPVSRRYRARVKQQVTEKLSA